MTTASLETPLTKNPAVLKWVEECAALLKPDQILAVGSYIYTLRGTKPPNPKPPENQVPADTGPNPYE